MDTMIKYMKDCKQRLMSPNGGYSDTHGEEFKDFEDFSSEHDFGLMDSSLFS